MRDITIVEVSPRDGLQNESEILSTDAKVDLITRLVDAGARRIEAVSFAHPKLVPTMADAEAVMARVPRRDDVSYAGLILNRKGLDRAVGAGVDEVNVVVCVSDTFSGRNQNVTADEAMKMAGDVVDAARTQGLVHHDHAGDRVRLPVRGRGRPGAGGGVRPALRRLRGAGAVPRRHRRGRGAGPGHRPHGADARHRRGACRCASTSTTPATPGSPTPTPRSPRASTCSTPARAASAVARSRPKATGNIATDDLVYMLERMGHRTGIDLTTLLPTAAFLGEQLGHEVPALLPRAGAFP